MEERWLTGSIPEQIDGNNRSFMERYKGLSEWFDLRYMNGVDPYQKHTDGEIGTHLKAFDRKGGEIEGINFASQDYLNLSSSHSVRVAAKKAIDDYGVHSAGSSALMGITRASIDLESALGNFTGFSDVTLFPTGWAAGYGIIRTLVKSADHVLIDVLCHACLHEGAAAATSNVSVYAHLSCTSIENRIRRIRDRDTNAAILVVTESLFSMDSDVPDIRKMQAICTEYGATLLVDCAHDFGSIGVEGGGFLEKQGMIGKVDILMGSFSKTFASNGGFVASNSSDLKMAIRATCGPCLFSNALSPVNAKIINTCLEIVSAKEGREKRSRLLDNSQLLREVLMSHGFEVLGQPSAIVPVVLGDVAISRKITCEASRQGVIVNLVEYPAVSKNGCRWRLQVMAEHTESQIRTFVSRIAAAKEIVYKEC